MMNMSSSSDSSSDDEPVTKRSHASTDQPKIANKAYKMMETMGWKPGARLGTDGQGIAEPIATKARKNRVGLGAETRIDSQALDMDLVKSLSWKPESDSSFNWDDPDQDLVWSFENPYASDQVSIERLLINLEEYRGPKPTVFDSTNFSDPRLCKAVCYYKSQLDSLDRATLLSARIRSNPFELVKSGIFLNRAAMKMANMDSIFHDLFSGAANRDDTLYFVDMCAGPGGFSEYLLWRRCQGSSGDLLANGRNLFPVKGFGFTLSGENDFKEFQFRASASELFKAHYGHKKYNNGDVTKWENQHEFVSFVAEQTKGKGLHVLMADGGFDVSDQQNEQEVKSKQLYLCQCLLPLMILRPGGTFVTKLFDLFTDFSVSLIYIISQLFESVAIVKPVTSRPANSERYLVCKRLLDFHGPTDSSDLPTMAGCPTFPADEASSSVQANSATVESNKTKSLVTGFKRPSNNAALMKSSSSLFMQKASIASTTASPSAYPYQPLFDTFLSQANNPLAAAICYLVDANAVLNSIEDSKCPVTNKRSLAPLAEGQDLLTICNLDMVRSDAEFMEFLVNANDQFAKRQCFHLSKLQSYCERTELSFTSEQMKLKQALLKRWRVPGIDRGEGHWPFWKPHYSAIIQNTIGSQPSKPTSLGLGWTQGHRSLKMEEFTSQMVEAEDFHKHCSVAVVLPNQITIADQPTGHPIMLFSRGIEGNCPVFYSEDGNSWKPFKNNIRLPAGCIVYAILTNHYQIGKQSLRRQSVTILDVLVLYGVDCRSLDFRLRITLAQRMVENVTFKSYEINTVLLRCATVVLLSNLQFWLDGLQPGSCKDLPGTPLMFKDDLGNAFFPVSMYIVKHVERPWLEFEERTGVYSYYNTKSDKKNSRLDAEGSISFQNTVFRLLAFKSADRFDTFKLANCLKADNESL